MRHVFHTAFVTCAKKTFWPENEVSFWDREGTSFETWKVGILISKCFKSRFRVETWTPVVRLILITCELVSRVTHCCVVMFMFLKELVNVRRDWNSVVAALEVLSSLLTRFAVADVLHGPCCFSILSLPCTFCASVPAWTLHFSWDSAAWLKDWQVPGK